MSTINHTTPRPMRERQGEGLEETLKLHAQAAVKALYGIDADDKQIQLQKTRPEFEGNITLVVFPFVKLARKVNWHYIFV